MSTPEPNPFELSEIDVKPVVRSRAATGPQPSDFSALMLQLCLMGVIICLPGTLVALAYWPVGVPMLSIGVLLLFVGRGLGAYKPWAWYAAVAILAPINLALAALFVFATFSAGAWGLATLFGPADCGYVLWTLLSPSGRECYWRNATAAARLDADRNRVVRKPFRKR